jgi:hypothetical protein
MVKARRGRMWVGFVLGALLAVTLAVFITTGFVDVVLLVLATGLVIASYAARRYSTRGVALPPPGRPLTGPVGAWVRSLGARTLPRGARARQPPGPLHRRSAHPAYVDEPGVDPAIRGDEAEQCWRIIDPVLAA